LIEATCRAHARSKIHDVYISSGDATAEEALKRIGELYVIEEEICGRQVRSKPRLYSLHGWMVEPDNNAA
jgi:transposase